MMRPMYHFTPEAHWMNDPNGLVFFNGTYHLFYQHHPYSTEWGPMHWGHACSRDLLHWEHLPIALAPDQPYDAEGCFSGTALEVNGRLVLMYTGNHRPDAGDVKRPGQVQCLAFSDDGVVFEKYRGNPVIVRADVESGPGNASGNEPVPSEGESAPQSPLHTHDFRDPKIWAEAGRFYCLVGSQTPDRRGQLLLFRSGNLTDWVTVGAPLQSDGSLGSMWECPDWFRLGGTDVVLLSVQGMEPIGERYLNLHQAGYFLGTLDTGKGLFVDAEGSSLAFVGEPSFRLLDNGFDFYAPQTLLTPDGRRVMIGWMAMWESELPEQREGWAGAMTVPRELTVEDGVLISRPVRELQRLRHRGVHYDDVRVAGELSLSGVQGVCAELRVKMRPADGCQRFGVRVRCAAEVGDGSDGPDGSEGPEQTVIEYDADAGCLRLNRERSGCGPGGMRTVPIAPDERGVLELHILLDHSSVEVFVQGGRAVLSARIYPQPESDGVVFFADGELLLEEVHCWSLVKGRSVLTVGELLVDSYGEEQKAGGAPANVAAVAAALGSRASFLGKLGQDPEADFLLAELASYGVDLQMVVRDEAARTAVAHVTVDEHGERSFTFERGADERLTLQEVAAGRFAEMEMVHFGSATAMLGGLGQATYDTYFALLERARSQGKFVSFDPNYREALWVGDDDLAVFVARSRAAIALADFVKVSEEELVLLTGATDRDAALELLHEWGAVVVAVTLGAAGAVISACGERRIMPSVAVQVVDSTGAGDAFVGSMLHQLAQAAVDPRDVPFDMWCDMVREANRIGALICTQAGALTALRERERWA